MNITPTHLMNKVYKYTEYLPIFYVICLFIFLCKQNEQILNFKVNKYLKQEHVN